MKFKMLEMLRRWVIGVVIRWLVELFRGRENKRRIGLVGRGEVEVSLVLGFLVGVGLEFRREGWLENRFEN